MVYLPPELWICIAQFLPSSTLRKMYSINRTFFELAMDSRYTEIQLDHVQRDLEAFKDRLKNPLISRRVRSLVVAPTSQASEEIAPRKRRRRTFRCSMEAVSKLLRLSKKTVPDRPDHSQQVLTRILSNLTQVRSLVVDWRDDIDHCPPYIHAAWISLGARLTSLSLVVPVHKLCLATAGHNELTSLSSLSITFIPPSAFQQDILEVQQGLEKLVSIISHSSAALEELEIVSRTRADLSQFFYNLKPLPRLCSVHLSAPLDGDLTEAPNGLVHFLHTHRGQLICLRLNHVYLSRGFSTPWQFPPGQIMSYLSRDMMPNLLILHFNRRLLVSLAELRNFTHTLHHLTISGHMTNDEVDKMVSLFAENPRGAKLEHLTIYAPFFTRRLVDILAEKLPYLRKLTLRIDVVDDGRYVTTPAEFFPMQKDPGNFLLDMRSRSYDMWNLQEITITRTSCCGTLILWGLMQILAERTPSIRGFLDNGDMLIPNPSNKLPDGHRCDDAFCLYGL